MTTRRGSKGKTETSVNNATRNRARAAISGFVTWAKTTGHLAKSVNPLSGVKIIREIHSPDRINVWDAPLVSGLLAAADKLPDGIAVWIAVLAGLRRGEIARVEWEDVGEAYISVRKSKTGTARQVPLSSALAARLAKIGGKKTGRIVPWPAGYDEWVADAKRIAEKQMPELYPPPEGITFPKLQYHWNTYRHTFASRHVQAGVPLDVVAAWIGDSVATCRRHYARFVPRDHRDTRIDLADPNFGTSPPPPKRKRRVQGHA